MKSRNWFKNIASCFLAFNLLTGCSSTAVSSAEQTYTSTNKGFGGDVTITIKTKNGKVTEASAVGDKETSGVGGQAIKAFNEGKLGTLVGLEASNLKIDSYTGATMTSTALKNDLKDIVRQAGGTSATAQSKSALKPGTYTESVYGNNYTRPFSVAVTLGTDSIDKIEVTDIGGETVDIIQTAIDKLIPRIEESQSLAVDSITGATSSSGGIKDAVASAIDDAGGDSSQWYTEVAKKTDTVTLDGYDVIVVGLGSAGLAAYCSAAESGAAVIGIDSAGKVGGTSTNVGGPMAVNPTSASVQPASGTANYPVDTSALKNKWISDAKGKAKEECVDLMVDSSGDTLDWLINDYGFTFTPVTTFMNNDLVVYSSYAPANGGTVTDMYVSALDKASKNNDKDQYLLELKAEQILKNSDGSISGIRAVSYDGTTYEIHASSVILCTGGYGGSSEMTKKYIGSSMSLIGMYQNDGTMISSAISDTAAGTYNISTPGMAHSARTTVDLKDSSVVPSHQKTLDAIVDSTNVLHVDQNGKRFCAGDDTSDITENAWKAGDCYYSIVTQEYMDNIKTNGLDQVYMMLNVQDESLNIQQLMKDPQAAMAAPGAKYALNVNDPITDLDTIIADGEKMGIVYEADSLSALADKINANELVTTVDAYNKYCVDGSDPEFGKQAANMISLSTSSTKYYAIKGTSYCYSTCGGLNVNAKIEVLDNSGSVIPGLYACGTDSLGVLLNEEEGYLDYGGVAHGWCLTSGKTAGTNAAAYAKSRS